MKSGACPEKRSARRNGTVTRPEPDSQGGRRADELVKSCVLHLHDSSAASLVASVTLALCKPMKADVDLGAYTKHHSILPCLGPLVSALRGQTFLDETNSSRPQDWSTCLSQKYWSDFFGVVSL